MNPVSGISSLSWARVAGLAYVIVILTLIWTIFLTGVGALVFRLLGAAILAYPIYYVHLIAVFMLFAYLPWSKLGHLVYRTVALSYAKKIGRIPMGADK